MLVFFYDTNMETIIFLLQLQRLYNNVSDKIASGDVSNETKKEVTDILNAATLLHQMHDDKIIDDMVDSCYNDCRNLYNKVVSQNEIYQTR